MNDDYYAIGVFGERWYPDGQHVPRPVQPTFNAAGTVDTTTRAIEAERITAWVRATQQHLRQVPR